MTIFPTGNEIDDPAVHMLNNGDVPAKENPGLSLESGTLLTGRNSGYQALNLAVLAGAKRVVLLGFDMCFKGGKSHWFGDHPIANVEADFRNYAKAFRTTLPQLERVGVEVLNCSPISLIDAFPKVTLEEALA